MDTVLWDLIREREISSDYGRKETGTIMLVYYSYGGAKSYGLMLM